MMKCEPVIAALSDILDKKASFWTRVSFTMHMMMCSKCRAYYRQFKELRELASTVEPDDLPEDFVEVMQQTLQRELSHSHPNREAPQ